MSAHTPGPWLIAGEDKCFVYALGPKGTNVFWASVQAAGAERASHDEKAANARLIAAAPELLEALKLARAELDGLPHSLGYEFTHIPKIDAAIRKATEAA